MNHLSPCIICCYLQLVGSLSCSIMFVKKTTKLIFDDIFVCVGCRAESVTIPSYVIVSNLRVSIYKEIALTFEIGLVLFILIASVVLFASEKIRVDLVAMMVLLTLYLTGLVEVEEAFAGFSSPAVITVWAIYIVSASLNLTGIADFIGSYIGRVAGGGEVRLLVVLMSTVGLMSAFMNNIGACAVLLPVAVDLGRKSGVPASKLLMPLAFGSLLGGVTTLIGTPPNLLINNALIDAGVEPFSLFDFSAMGIIIMVSGIVYMTLFGRNLLPRHAEATRETSIQQRSKEASDYDLNALLVGLKVLPSSLLIGRTIVDSRLGEMYDLTVLGVERDGRLRLGALLPNAHLQEGDVLVALANPQRVATLPAPAGLNLIPQSYEVADLQTPETTLAEVVVSQLGQFEGQTLRDIDFRERYGLTVLAIWREESYIVQNVADVPLHLGDTLLVYGRTERVEAARNVDALLLLEPPKQLYRINKAPMNLVIFISMIALVATGTLHISVAAVLGAMLSVLTGCLNMDEAYNAIQWNSVFLIAGMLPMGVAMEKTGTALFLSEQMISLVGGMGPSGVMMGLFVLTTILTAFMSNAAAAVLVAPIAIQTAVALGVAPQAFVMGVAMSASNSFVTPIGHQVCVLVYGPGGYRFFDYAKVGFPLTVIIWILMLIFLPIFWPL